MFSLANLGLTTPIDFAASTPRCTAVVSGETAYFTTKEGIVESPASTRRGRITALSKVLDISLEFDPQTRAIQICHETAKPILTLPPSLRTSASFDQFASHFMTLESVYHSLHKFRSDLPVDFVLYNEVGLLIIAENGHHLSFQKIGHSEFKESFSSPKLSRTSTSLSLTHKKFEVHAAPGRFSATLKGKKARILEEFPDQFKYSKLGLHADAVSTFSQR